MPCPHALLRRRSTAVLSEPFPFWHNLFAVRFHAQIVLRGHMEKLWEQNRCSPWATEKRRRQVQSLILTSEGLSQYPTSNRMHGRHKASARRFDRQAATANSLTVRGTRHLKAKTENIYARSFLLNRMCQSWARGNMGAIMFPLSPESMSVTAQRPQWPGKALGPVQPALAGVSVTHRTKNRPSGGDLFSSLTVYTNKWSSVYLKRGESGSEQQTYWDRHASCQHYWHWRFSRARFVWSVLCYQKKKKKAIKPRQSLRNKYKQFDKHGTKQIYDTKR